MYRSARRAFVPENRFHSVTAEMNLKNLFRFYVFPDTQQGNCYTRIASDRDDCTDPLPMKLSKKDCCCGKDMGKGWGNACEVCPSQGMGKYSFSPLKADVK